MPRHIPHRNSTKKTSGGGIYRVGGGVSPPRLLSNRDPEYSERARKAGYAGTCVLWLTIDEQGMPRDIKVSRSLDMGLDEKAIEAVRQWRFAPAMKDGAPVAVGINVESVVPIVGWRCDQIRKGVPESRRGRR